MKPTEPERITPTETKTGDVLIDKTRTIRVLEARSYPEIGAYKLICRDVGALPSIRPRVMWISATAPLHRFMSNDEITVWQAAGLIP
jgi:hypothetical protein